MKKLSVNLVIIFSAFLPSLVFAGTYLNNLLIGIKSLINQLVFVLVAAAVCWFIWNVAQYSFTSSDNKDKKNIAKEQMIKGVIAIAVIVSFWGIINIISIIFNVGQTNGPTKNNLENIIPNISLVCHNWI